MPRYKQPKDASKMTVSKAWEEFGEIGACKAAISKYAKVLDMTDSGRDIKPLVTGMFEMIDRLKSLEAKDNTKAASTPLFKILDRAENE